MHLLGPSLPFMLLSAPPAPRTTSIVAVEVPGAQPQDLFYIVGVFAVAAFGGRAVFDSSFPENDEFVPPKPTLPGLPGPLQNIPFFGGNAADPASEAEDLRQRLLIAAEAGDLREAYQLEKQLKNLMAESGMRLVVDEQYQQTEDAEQLPDKW